jgi:hypothetical protein
MISKKTQHRPYKEKMEVEIVRNLVGHGDARGEVKRKLANGVGSQYSHATSERGVSSITQADAHTSAARSRLNWRPPTDSNGLVRFGERRNLVSARVPLRSARSKNIVHSAIVYEIRRVKDGNRPRYYWIMVQNYWIMVQISELWYKITELWYRITELWYRYLNYGTELLNYGTELMNYGTDIWLWYRIIELWYRYLNYGTELLNYGTDIWIMVQNYWIIVQISELWYRITNFERLYVCFFANVLKKMRVLN